MIDHSRITSGYDIELLFGIQFFERAFKSLYDAGRIPHVIQITETITLEVNEPIEVSFYWFEVTVPQPDGSELTPVADLKVSVPLKVNFGDDETLERTADLFLRLNLEEVVDPVSNLANRVNIVPEYLTMDDETRQEIADRTFNVPELMQMAEDQLREIVQKDIASEMVPGSVQKMAIRKLGPSADFQACYALYVNLNLKLGELYRIDDSSGFPIPYVLPPEPNDQPTDRGDAAEGQNFLPLDRDMAVGCPPEIYERLARDRMHSFTEIADKDTWHRPLRDIGGHKVGHHKSLSIQPAVMPSVFTGGETVQHLKITSKVHVSAADVDATTKIYITPKIDENGELDTDVVVTEPEADTSFFDFLIFFGGVVLAFILGPVIGIMAGVAAGASLFLSGMVFGMSRFYKERYEAEGKETVEGMMERDQSGLSSFMGLMPTHVTIAANRVDPFYYHAYTVKTRFIDMDFASDGISLAGMLENAEEPHRLIHSIRIAGRVRETEPVGELQGLIYHVPGHWEVNQSNEAVQIDPELRPELFYLTLLQTYTRIDNGLLADRIRLRPTHVRLRSGKISELYFSSRGALSPYEIYELQRNHVAWMPGYDLIRPRGGRPYYRSHPDAYPHNNLSNLPAYECARSKQLSERFNDVTQSMLYLAGRTEARVYLADPEGFPLDRREEFDKSISELAYNYCSSYPLIKAMIEEAVEGAPPETTEEMLNNAIYDPSWPVNEMAPYDVTNWLPSLNDPLVVYIASLNDKQLDKTNYVGVFDEELDVFRMTLKLARHLSDRIQDIRNQERDWRSMKG